MEYVTSARRNVRITCEALNVPLLIKGPKASIQEKIIREIFLVSEGLGCFVMTCNNCELMLRTVALEVAREYGVPFILWGSSSMEAVSNSQYENYRYGRKFLETLVSKKATLKKLQLTPRKIVRIIPRLMKYMVLIIYQRFQMGVPIRYLFRPFGARPFPVREPTVIHVFDYILLDPL